MSLARIAVADGRRSARRIIAATGRVGDRGASSTRKCKATNAVASSQPFKSEAQGVGEAEFSPWSLGGRV
jgi:hypothetical protein